MAFDQEAFDRECDADQADAERRAASEAALDDLSGAPSALVAKVARRVLAALRQYELVNLCSDHFEDGLRETAEVLKVPYIELTIAAHTDMHNPEIVRTDLDEWVAWCQEHAPERLNAQKGGA